MGRWGRSIPSDPNSWECDETGVKDNLWLNLSTGFIGSGRQVRLLCDAAVLITVPCEAIQSHVDLMYCLTAYKSKSIGTTD